MKRIGESGLTLTEVMVVTGIGSILTIGLGTVLMRTAQLQSKAMELGAIEGLQQQILRGLTDDRAWLKTLSGNSNMDCLRNGTACGTASYQEFTLYDANGAVVYDGSGLTARGTRCSGYSASGNDQCPYRFELRWKPVCSGSCPPNPQITIDALLRHSPATRSAVNINLALYSITGFVRSNGPASQCLAQTMIVQPGQAATLILPSGYRGAFIEAWGGGGGGAGTDWACNVTPGTRGGDSRVVIPGLVTLVASGGDPGTRPISNGRHWIENAAWFPYVGTIWWLSLDDRNYCRGSGGNYAGGQGQAPPSPPPTPPPNTCSGLVGRTWTPGAQQTARGASGNYVGGGGAGRAANGNDVYRWCCNPVVIEHWYVSDSQGGGLDVAGVWTAGRYVSRYISPATVSELSTVTMTAGAGGAGGAGAGSGAPGVIKISWW